MSGKRNIILNIIIIVLTIILFCMAAGLMVETRPRDVSRYGLDTAEYMIRELERGKYSDLMQSKYTNEMMGISAEDNDAYTVPFAASDYYEAAFNYNGYLLAGDKEGASEYKDKMEVSRKAMGKYRYIADDIDELLRRDR